MTKGKQVATQLLVIALVLFALVVAFPASAGDLACPRGWTQTPVAQGDPEDRNLDGEVCMKQMQNKLHFKDNHR